MKFGSLNWNHAKGAGSATVNADFDEANIVERLDAITDWIVDLTNLYNALNEANLAVFTAKLEKKP